MDDREIPFGLAQIFESDQKLLGSPVLVNDPGRQRKEFIDHARRVYQTAAPIGLVSELYGELAGVLGIDEAALIEARGPIDEEVLSKRNGHDADGYKVDWEKYGQANKAAGQRALRLTYFEDLSDKPTAKLWITKNVIARGETSSWIAPPGKGKSALLTDIAVHAAGGIPWRGYASKGQCGVVYFALERADLVRRRLTAHKRRDGLAHLPIAVAGEVIDLLNRNCVDILLATIREAEQRFAREVGLVIFDTYSKGIAAGGGDEDKAKDQNIVQANLRRLFDRGCNMHIAGIGHTGKDENRGERGSNARLADVDLQVQISGDEVKTVTVTKGNDQPEGVLTSFKLESFDFGCDEDGDPFKTYILAPELYAAGTGRTQPTQNQKLGMGALTEVTLTQGCDPPGEYRLPQGIKVVTLDAWQEELFRANVIKRDGSNPRARFNELHNALKARSLIGSRDQWVWAAAHIHPQHQPPKE